MRLYQFFCLILLFFFQQTLFADSSKLGPNNTTPVVDNNAYYLGQGTSQFFCSQGNGAPSSNPYNNWYNCTSQDVPGGTCKAGFMPLAILSFVGNDACSANTNVEEIIIGPSNPATFAYNASQTAYNICLTYGYAFTSGTSYNAMIWVSYLVNCVPCPSSGCTPVLSSCPSPYAAAPVNTKGCNRAGGGGGS